MEMPPMTESTNKNILLNNLSNGRSNPYVDEKNRSKNQFSSLDDFEEQENNAKQIVSDQR